jgi:hypothetical protein
MTDLFEARFLRLRDCGLTRWMAMTWRAYLDAYPNCDSSSRYNAEHMIADARAEEIALYGFEMTEEALTAALEPIESAA